jgi:hypothetical protein
VSQPAGDAEPDGEGGSVAPAEVAGLAVAVPSPLAEVVGMAVGVAVEVTPAEPRAKPGARPAPPRLPGRCLVADVDEDGLAAGVEPGPDRARSVAC